MELTTLTDEQLEEHRVSLLAELDRRNKLRDIPNDIRKLAQDFESLGGSRTDLIAKIEEPTDELAPGSAETADPSE